MLWNNLVSLAWTVWIILLMRAKGPGKVSTQRMPVFRRGGLPHHYHTLHHHADGGGSAAGGGHGHGSGRHHHHKAANGHTE